MLGAAMTKIGEKKYHTLLRSLPVVDLDKKVLGRENRYWRKWIEHPINDAYWDQASFLNACLRVQTELEPLALLDVLKGLEQELGRPAEYQRHSPRAIDIDVLLLGDLVLSHERMTLPHAQVLTRRFVLIPALELDFELATPDGRRLADAPGPPVAGEAERWEEAGYWLVPLIALIGLLWFRRGWVLAT